MVKVKFKNGRFTEVKKGPNGMFKCQCGKTFKLLISLQMHVKQCNGESVVITWAEEEDVMMLDDDVDMSESSLRQERNMLADCFGALIS